MFVDAAPWPAGPDADSVTVEDHDSDGMQTRSAGKFHHVQELEAPARGPWPDLFHPRGLLGVQSIHIAQI